MPFKIFVNYKCQIVVTLQNKRESSNFSLKTLKDFAMKILAVILIAANIGLSSCSSAYKTAQTPDDVYYSPASETSHTTNNSNTNTDEYYNANPDDQYLRMKVQDPQRWSAFDSYDGYDAFSYPYYGGGFGYGMGLGMGYYGIYSPWSSFGFWNPYYSYMNSYYMWNSFYNPYYYYNTIAVGPKSPTYAYYNGNRGLRPFNLNAYSNGIYRNTNSLGSSYNRGSNASGNSYYNNRNSFQSNYSNQRSNSYNGNSNSNNNRSFSQPVRSFTPASTPSSNSNFGGGSRSSGGGGFSRSGRP